MVNLRLPNGHIAEVQFGLDSLVIVKHLTHWFYTLARTESTGELLTVVQLKHGVIQAETADVCIGEKDDYGMFLWTGMSRYLQIQLILWFELVVISSSADRFSGI